jgi:SpoVK/Ycf46/Vps4 family AAA+-type ATPase
MPPFRLPSPGCLARVRNGTTQYRELVPLLKGLKAAPQLTVVLLAGPSGTGKTLAASALASGLGLPLRRIDLSATVGTYIGETEKNLETVLSRAGAGGGVLFFDEADALFGKRTPVADAHDRYANLEVSHLLARHRGVILASVRHAPPAPPLPGAVTWMVIDV